MSYFKKFTDFCAGAAAFAASLFLIRKYMSYIPSNTEEDAPSKLAQFFDEFQSYSMLVSLILVLALSVAVGIIFRRLPYVCFAVSVLPALHIAYMFEKDILYEQEALYVICAALHVIGNLAECALRDRADGRHRLSFAAKLSSALGALICLFTVKLIDKKPAERPEELEMWKEDIFYNMKELDMEIITALGWMLFVLFLISLLLYNVYFIDAILSIIPIVYAVHAYFSGNLQLAPKTFMILAAICFAAHIMLMVLENNLSYKEQKKIKEQAE